MNVHYARLTLPAVAALGLALTACGDGDSDGTQDRDETSIENPYIVPAFDRSCVLQIDAPAQLSFTATNNSSTSVETLQEISTPAASAVSISAPERDLRMEPNTSIAAGQPVENTDESTAPDEPFGVSLSGLQNSLQPGISVPVTFRFERAGAIVVDVAVDACPTQVSP